MSSFLWPENKPAALSLTFDDARFSQLENGVPILDSHGVRATFYILPRGLQESPDEWRIVAQTHEIGNHTMTHPCSGKFDWSRHNALEDYTMEKMESELLGANEVIRQITGAKAQTFAYPCGQTFVGKDESSYVPLIAQHFLAGRGGSLGAVNNPQLCDMARLSIVSFDLLPFDEVQPHLDSALQSGGWLILIGHDVSNDLPRQAVRTDTLEAVCRYAQENNFCIDTVESIARYISQNRSPNSD